MTPELFFIILLALFVIILMGVALHLAKTIEQLRQYIGELERDIRQMNCKVFGDAIADKQKGGVTAK